MRLPFGYYPPILVYHRIASEHSSATPTLCPETFERQMAILSRRWKPVPLSTVADALDRGGALPPRAVVVTFDDGTEDNFTFAFPILKRCRIPATIFLIAGQIGRPGYLSPDHIARMVQGGVSFGSHGMDHEYLPSLAPADLKRTLSESKRAIERLGVPAEFISYPGGGYTPDVLEAARAAGYRGGCTTHRGFRRFPPNRWEMRRITMHESARSPLGLWLRCCGYYGLNRRLHPPA